jgi:hypothetical protein
MKRSAEVNPCLGLGVLGRVAILAPLKVASVPHDIVEARRCAA